MKKISKAPLVSVALATYNGDQFLDKQLNSIFSQSYENIEVIVCDDCSDDSTIEILEKYSKNYNLTYYRNERNIGYVRNFEKLIELCNGEYIALSDQDDVWLVNKIERLLANIGDNLCIHSDAKLIDHFGKVISESFSKYSQKLTVPGRLYELALNGCVTGCTCLFKAELKQDILPFPPNLDVHDRWIGAVSYAKSKLLYLDEPLIEYRQHGKNSIGAVKSNSFVISIFYRWLKKNYATLFKVDSKFTEVYVRHYNFLCIFIISFEKLLTTKEKSRLINITRVYNKFSRDEGNITLFVEYLRFFNDIEIGKNTGFKILSCMNVFRQIILKKFQ